MSAEAYVWPVSCGLPTENRQNRQKLLNLSEISRFRSLKNRSSLKISQEGSGVMGSTEVRPSTPNCMGHVKSQNTFFSQRKTFFLQKTQQFSDFYSPFSQRPMIVG